MVISLPRTRISQSNADSISFRNASRWPRRATIDWWPGTRIFTWVVAFATCVVSRGGAPFPPVSSDGRRRRPPVILAVARRRPQPGGQAIGRPPSRWKCRWNTALTGVRTDVRDQAPARLGDALGLARDAWRPARCRRARSPCSSSMSATESMCSFGISRMCTGACGFDVAERHHAVGLVHDLGRDLPGRDPAEDAARRRTPCRTCAKPSVSGDPRTQASGRRSSPRAGSRLRRDLAAELRELLESFRSSRERSRRRHHVHRHVQVAPAAAVDVRHALAAAAGSTVPDSVPGSIRRCSIAVERLDLHVRAERRLRHRDVERSVNRSCPRRSNASDGSTRMPTNRSPGGPAGPARVPGAADPQLHPVGDAGRDVDRRPSGARARAPRRSTSRTCRGSPGPCPRTSRTARRSSPCRRCSGASAAARRSRRTSGTRPAPSRARAPLPRHRSHTDEPFELELLADAERRLREGQRIRIVARSSPRRVRVGPRGRAAVPPNPPPKNMSKMSWMSVNRGPAGPPVWPNVSYAGASAGRRGSRTRPRSP